MSKEYPIAETFVSPQGEGLDSGRLMFFIRTAGCNVGKRYPKEMYEQKLWGQEVLPIYTNECTTFDGRKFACDTDYRCHQKLTVDQLLELKPPEVKCICLTGGEPFMHDLEPLILAAIDTYTEVHIETSGTIDASVLIKSIRNNS